MTEDGTISKYTYNNALTIALISGDFALAKDFLENYKNNLPAKERKNTYNYNLANFYFSKEEYESVLDLLQQVQFRDVLYNLHTRRMQMCAYYELREYKMPDSAPDSFQVFLSGRHDLGYHKLNYLNLVKFTRKLLAVRHLKEGKAELVSQIKNTKSLAYKEWLLKKSEE